MEEQTVDKGRVLGIDFGKRFVGVAISDPLFLTAQPLVTIERKRPDKLRSTLAKLCSICEDESVSSIVVGLPLNPDGSENERCAFTREFGEALFKRSGIPIIYVDESLTTVCGDYELSLMGRKSHREKKQASDVLAAMFILQDYMERVKNGKG